MHSIRAICSIMLRDRKVLVREREAKTPERKVGHKNAGNKPENDNHNHVENQDGQNA